MPTYDYVCGGCGHQFETFQSITAKVLRKCPECGALRLSRLIGGGSGFLFKGSGFYETDYRSESYRQGAAAESKAGKGPAATDKGVAGKTGTDQTANDKSSGTQPASKPAEAPAKARAASSGKKPSGKKR